MQLDPPTSSSANLPWVEKYRPLGLKDLVSQNDIIQTLEKLINERHLPHLLFYGPPGTGKTSTILACARRLYGTAYPSMILELNASDERGIDMVRDKIKSFASTRNIHFGQKLDQEFKLVVLDEADAMTQAAQAALRRVMERYTANVRFCLICNYATKIIPAIQSRCTRFRFSPLKTEQIIPRLKEIVHAEQMMIDASAIEACVTLAEGDMRRVLHILQSCNAAFDVITKEEIYQCTGQPTPEVVERLIHSMLNDPFDLAHSTLKRFQAEQGLALMDMITQVRKYMNELQLKKAARIFLLKSLADLEYHLAMGATEGVQFARLVGIMKITVDLTSID